MIEAQITCRCKEIKLADLGLYLVNGEIAYMEQDKAKASKDLTRAWRAQAVTVRYIQRFREVRPSAPDPGAVPTHVPGKAFISEPPPVSTLLADPDEIARRVLDVVRGPGVKNAVRVEVGRQMAALTTNLTEVFRSVIQEEVAKLQLTGVPVSVDMIPTEASAPRLGIVSDDEPRFIPSKIGRDDLQADLEVDARTEEAAGVSDAAAALKAARQSQKK